MNPSYPSAAEAVDSHLSKAIDNLAATTNTGIDRIERRIDNMATKDALQAQVARLDLRVDHVETKIDAGFKANEARDAKRDQAAKERDEARDRKFAQRMTWTLAVAGLLWSVAQWLIVNSS